MPSYSSVKGYQVLEIMFVSQEPAKGHSLLVPLRVVPVSALTPEGQRQDLTLLLS